MRARRLLQGIALTVSLLTSGIARSQTRDEALAQALFEEGRHHVAEGRIQEGCAALARSEAIDPSAGTLLNLALCHEAMGRVDLAEDEFETSLAIANVDRREDRAQIAREHLARLRTADEPAERSQPQSLAAQGSSMSPISPSSPVMASSLPTRGPHVMGIELVVTIAVFFAAGARRRRAH